MAKFVFSLFKETLNLAIEFISNSHHEQKFSIKILKNYNILKLKAEFLKLFNTQHMHTSRYIYLYIYVYILKVICNHGALRKFDRTKQQ